MRAIELIKILEDKISKYGENIEVFVELPGMNYEEVFNTRDYIGTFVHVDNLSEYDDKLLYEKHGVDDGLIHAVVLRGDESIEVSG